ncbi:hypothetical protein BJ508DRAFT_310963 [Ascobolus immersus RN42]|uniref:Uncharacterized protein n=1 Tax=Ascobolus immersus RN42 TaxID=1160509 RepID=A0A3N4HTC8_ASCIM|nr:hypothetical protein BJ508DRAFT_310963 [Ascobolus immersus RN42]
MARTRNPFGRPRLQVPTNQAQHQDRGNDWTPRPLVKGRPDGPAFQNERFNDSLLEAAKALKTYINSSRGEEQASDGTSTKHAAGSTKPSRFAGWVERLWSSQLRNFFLQADNRKWLMRGIATCYTIIILVYQWTETFAGNITKIQPLKIIGTITIVLQLFFNYIPIGSLWFRPFTSTLVLTLGVAVYTVAMAWFTQPDPNFYSSSETKWFYGFTPEFDVFNIIAIVVCFFTDNVVDFERDYFQLISADDILDDELYFGIVEEVHACYEDLGWNLSKRQIILNIMRIHSTPWNDSTPANVIIPPPPQRAPTPRPLPTASLGVQLALYADPQEKALVVTRPQPLPLPESGKYHDPAEYELQVVPPQPTV